jgi:hypothetical protein
VQSSWSQSAVPKNISPPFSGCKNETKWRQMESSGLEPRVVQGKIHDWFLCCLVIAHEDWCLCSSKTIGRLSQEVQDFVIDDRTLHKPFFPKWQPERDNETARSVYDFSARAVRWVQHVYRAVMAVEVRLRRKLSTEGWGKKRGGWKKRQITRVEQVLPLIPKLPLLACNPSSHLFLDLKA